MAVSYERHTLPLFREGSPSGLLGNPEDDPSFVAVVIFLLQLPLGFYL